MAHVFISYAHVDGDFVSLLRIELERAGFEAWIDHERLRAGDSWREDIDSAIREAFAMIAVMSPAAFESKYVTYEWAFGYGTGLKIIPVLLQPTGLHPRLEDFQYLDFTHRHGRPWEELMRRLDEVADSRGGALAYRLPLTVPYPIRNAFAGLDSRSEQERRDSINALAQAKHQPEAVEALARAVEHDFQDVRIQAALALAQVTGSTDARAVPGLLEALRDKESYVRVAAAAALEKIGTPEALAAAEEWQRQRGILRGDI